jgi:uncharacterized protein YcbK (DUF882 family)
VRLLALLCLISPVAFAGEEEELSKKAEFLKDKETRHDVHARSLPKNACATKVITLHNVWTNEFLAVPEGDKLAEPRFDELVRCHYTNQATEMDQRLAETVLRAAHKFGATYVEIVSGFRAPKYQLMLRKKGHEVARDSEHPRGHAVDFRLAGVTTKQLLRFVKSLHLGGVGYYPESHFVHADVGRVRFWRGH